MTEKTTEYAREILTRAADCIRLGFHKGSMAATKNGDTFVSPRDQEAAAWCILGALDKAVDEMRRAQAAAWCIGGALNKAPPKVQRRYDLIDWSGTLLAWERVTMELAQKLDTEEWVTREAWAESRLSRWNDAPKRTADDVIDLISGLLTEYPRGESDER